MTVYFYANQHGDYLNRQITGHAHVATYNNWVCIG